MLREFYTWIRSSHFAAASLVMVGLCSFMPRVQADCLNNFLKSGIFHTQTEREYFDLERRVNHQDDLFSQPRSEWGKYASTKPVQVKYTQFQFTHRPSILVFEDSLAHHHHELVNLIDDLDLFQLSPHEFKAQAGKMTKHFSEADFYDFFESRNDLLQQGFERLKAQVKTIDPKKAVVLEKAFRTRLNELNSIHDFHAAFHGGENVYSLKASDFLHEAETFSHRASGLLGEFYAFVSLPRVSQMSVTLGESAEISGIIKNKFDHLFKQLQTHKDPRMIERFVAKHPTLMRNMGVGESSPSKILARLKSFIESKEIDFIRTGNDGKSKWGEVKFYRSPITEERLRETGDRLVTFQHDGFTHTKLARTKSLLEQISEDKEIVDFLGLTKRVDIEYLAPLSNNAKQVLKEKGIQLVPTHD